ncbi:GntR family transcriptional regulator [Mesorhizobium sp. L-8-3]|uniref:GntR family transcriptional regulator n=1 Tax=Mesorhizobium sp. L-8-3 TaxID=2744522 RepID=UPI001926E40F|nr:GntR family transcriptional regulator [Mesorhizobium sp. L-8-3]BCH22917.1 GntR family transcriptional regulator [Mesorhizobium sp. L-8-3]
MTTKPLQRGDRAQHVVNQIREAIITGALAPGSALRQEELAANYASSRMPIREALRTLSAEGLVQLIPNRGAIVAPIDIEELRENFEMREAAEVLAIRLAVPHLSNAQIDQAASIQKQIDTAPIQDFGPLNKAFHCTLYAPAGRPRLIAHIGSLHDIADRYLRFTLLHLDYNDRSSSEHEAILDACYRRDIEVAMRLTSTHILEAGKTLESYLREHLGTRLRSS